MYSSLFKLNTMLIELFIVSPSSFSFSTETVLIFASNSYMPCLSTVYKVFVSNTYANPSYIPDFCNSSKVAY
jgi:hypothetical protein